MSTQGSGPGQQNPSDIEDEQGSIQDRVSEHTRKPHDKRDRHNETQVRHIRAEQPITAQGRKTTRRQTQETKTAKEQKELKQE